MCEDCGKDKESSNNYFVPMGSFWAEFAKQQVIKENGCLVTPVFRDPGGDTEKMKGSGDGK